MFYSRQTSLRLHEEHLATIQLWGRLEQSIAARVAEAELDALLRNCSAALAEEVTRHFEFEERELFTRLAEAGDGDIAELLTEEHETIRSAAHALRELLALPQPDAAARRQLGALGLELAERLVAHVQKEEMALLPALEDLLDEETDRELALAYANS
ncbi:MAG: hypothetical protein A2Z64_01885 [Betaproteobacteria bacterium RIFCSPLOWO2_02_67_12]|nr:MAG: hypothetical protein A2Z64_01885 [Betaproteobacteria bacterium RIFCSPLOWO2_02_67_12]OGA28458.1 MAG: hypothetical protein A3I65_06425 [Betaproteobacteria bacterium RIFCSPLOWO2_02_FULL_68_150]OGA70516.1 MAG: hypothetical protein A3F77_08160 [Betaproteobacteria bacterium RIFCSPLOWO2_12_FULL_67_28]